MCRQHAGVHAISTTREQHVSTGRHSLIKLKGVRAAQRYAPATSSAHCCMLQVMLLKFLLLLLLLLFGYASGLA